MHSNIIILPSKM